MARRWRRFAQKNFQPLGRKKISGNQRYPREITNLYGYKVLEIFFYYARFCLSLLIKIIINRIFQLLNKLYENQQTTPVSF